MNATRDNFYKLCAPIYIAIKRSKDADYLQTEDLAYVT